MSWIQLLPSCIQIVTKHREQTTRPAARAKLEAVDVAKDFGGVAALRGVSLELEEGRIFGLIGPNGSGKTTLLNCISGVSHPTRGRVTLDGQDITRSAAAKIARLGVARTFQNIRLFDRLSVRSNIEVSALAAGRLGRRKAQVEADALAEEFGLEEVRDAYASDLSYGDRRRVEIARALSASPRFLLLDEPAAGMNEAETSQLGDLIEQIRGTRGCGVLLVDHDLELIMLHCEEIKVLNEGEEIAYGSPAEVQSSEAVIAAYIGDAATPETGSRAVAEPSIHTGSSREDT